MKTSLSGNYFGYFLLNLILATRFISTQARIAVQVKQSEYDIAREASEPTFGLQEPQYDIGLGVIATMHEKEQPAVHKEDHNFAEELVPKPQYDIGMGIIATMLKEPVKSEQNSDRETVAAAQQFETDLEPEYDIGMGMIATILNEAPPQDIVPDVPTETISQEAEIQYDIGMGIIATMAEVHPPEADSPLEETFENKISTPRIDINNSQGQFDSWQPEYDIGMGMVATMMIEEPPKNIATEVLTQTVSDQQEMQYGIGMGMTATMMIEEPTHDIPLESPTETVSDQAEMEYDIGMGRIATMMIEEPTQDTGADSSQEASFDNQEPEYDIGMGVIATMMFEEQPQSLVPESQPETMTDQQEMEYDIEMGVIATLAELYQPLDAKPESEATTPEKTTQNLEAISLTPIQRAIPQDSKQSKQNCSTLRNSHLLGKHMAAYYENHFNISYGKSSNFSWDPTNKNVSWKEDAFQHNAVLSGSDFCFGESMSQIFFIKQ